MSTQIKSDDVIFNFFKQICDEEDDSKCISLGNNWVEAMEKNLNNMEVNLEETDRVKHKEGINSNDWLLCDHETFYFFLYFSPVAS